MLDKNERYFLETVKKGNLTKAAAALSISQPALSMGLNSLEKKLGFRLLDRRTSPVSLTREGEIYLRFLNSRDALETNFEKEIQDSLEDSGRKIRVGAPLVYAETLLADYIGKNTDQVDYSIKVASQHELAEMLESAQIDCYISTSNRDFGKLKKKVIGSEKICLCVPKSFGFSFNGNYESLDHMNFVLLEKDQPLQVRIDAFFEKYGIHPSSYTVCNQVSTCISCALQGAGMCFASRDALIVKNVSEQFDLIELPDDLFKRSIYLIYDEAAYLSDACRKMIEEI